MDTEGSKTQKTNSELKNSNIKRVFWGIQSNGSISRKKLQENTSLSWGSISLNINTLNNMGLIVESTELNAYVGRKPKSIDINPDDNYLIGIDIQKSIIRSVITDLKGRIVLRYNSTISYTDKSSVLANLYQHIDHVIENIRKDKKVISIGIAVQGIVCKYNSTSNLFPGFIDWNQVDLKNLVEKRYNKKCYVFHDPDAIMCAEMLLYDLRNSSLKNTVLVRLEDGVGSSIMINRELFTSRTGKSGEIGHINVEKDGLLCEC